MMCGFEFNAISLFGMMCYLLRNLVHFRLHSSGWKSSVRLEPRTQFLFQLINESFFFQRLINDVLALAHLDGFRSLLESLLTCNTFGLCQEMLYPAIMIPQSGTDNPHTLCTLVLFHTVYIAHQLVLILWRVFRVSSSTSLSLSLWLCGLAFTFLSENWWSLVLSIGTRFHFPSWLNFLPAIILL